jgi:HSP20 family molecular chaperone IbpA
MTDKQIMSKENGSINKVEKALPINRFSPAVDIYETDSELVVLADLPGVKEQALQVEVDRGVLTIEAEQEVVEGAARTAFYRQFKLSERIDSDAGVADLKDGVLTLKLPKSEAAKPKKIAVKTLH